MTRRGEAGNVLLLTALSLVVLMGFMGLALDMGMLRYEKRAQQTAADAAAIAGATNLASGSSVLNGALAASANVGFADNTNGGTCAAPPTDLAIGSVAVTVCDPPELATDPHRSDAQYVEVYVSVGHPTFFMKILGIDRETVTARAVATDVGGGGPGCLYLLGPAPAGFTGHGGGSKGGLIAPTCGVVDNGNFTTTGGFPVCAGTISVAGSGTGGGTDGSCTAASPGSGPTCNDQSVSTCPAPIPAARNPLAYLTIPAQPAPTACSGNCFNPGTYTSNIRITGNKSYIFNPGIYVLNGATFSCAGTPTITGNGVMFYLENNATFDCAGTSAVTLTAPSASNCPACPTWSDGILMYQDPKTDQQADTLSGGGNSDPDEGYYGLVVLWGLTMNGNDLAVLGGTAGFGAGPLKNAILVE